MTVIAERLPVNNSNSFRPSAPNRSGILHYLSLSLKKSKRKHSVFDGVLYTTGYYPQYVNTRLAIKDLVQLAG